MEDNTLPNEYYWAAETVGGPEEEENPGRKLVGWLNQKTKKFLETLRGTLHVARIARNHRYYHGRYYEGSSSPNDMEMAVFGSEGEYVSIPLNEFRSLLEYLVILTTQNRPAWDTKAINADAESLQAAKLGNAILDYYMAVRGVERIMRECVENAVVENVGYVYTFWDSWSGPSVEEESSLLGPQPIGDVRYVVPRFLDVAFDLTATSWSEVEWVRIRMPTNKWNLIAKYPEMKEKILLACQDQDDDQIIYRNVYDEELYSDQAVLYHFYHRPSPAMPNGRFAASVGDTLLEVSDWPDDLPIDRIEAGRYVHTCLGYSVANDLEGLQEWLEGEISVILTAHKALGNQNIYGGPVGSPVTQEVLVGGLNVVYGENKPEPLNVLETPPEILKMPDWLVKTMERRSGVNAVSRGQVDREMSGTALALLDAKTLQATSKLQSDYYGALEGVGTKTLRFIKRYGGSAPRTIAIIGRYNRQFLQQFKASALSPVDTVLVLSGNAMAKNPSGRMAMASELLANHKLSTPEEYFTVHGTGQLDTLLQAENSELALIHEENAKLLDGQTMVASPNDNHILHIREHNSLLASVDMRRNPKMSSHILAHMMEHTNLLMQPSTQVLQMTLGYQVPPIFAQLGSVPSKPMGEGGGMFGLPGPGGPGGSVGPLGAPSEPGKPPGPGAPPKEKKIEGSGNPGGDPKAMASPPRQPAFSGM